MPSKLLPRASHRGRDCAMHAAEHPRHHRRQQRKRQREQRVAEADSSSKWRIGALNHDAQSHERIVRQLRDCIGLANVLQIFAIRVLCDSVRLLRSPALRQRVLDAELIANPRDDEIDQVADSIARRDTSRARPAARPRRLRSRGACCRCGPATAASRAARGSACGVPSNAPRPPAESGCSAAPAGHGAERRAAARADHHAGGEERAAGHRGHEILVVVVVELASAALLRPLITRSSNATASRRNRRDRSSSFELLPNHVAAGRADRKMHIAPGGAQHFQQPHRVDRAARAGDAEDRWDGS